MTSSDEIIHEINTRLSEAVSLTVGRMIEDSIEGEHLTLDSTAADALREQCAGARDRISEGNRTAYTATAELAVGDYFVIDDHVTLSELGAFRSLAEDLGAMRQVTPTELNLTIKLYSVSVGDGLDRILFVRKANPRLAHKSGGFFAVDREQLTRIEEPIFSFAPSFDFILGPGWAVVLNQKSFEILFRQLGIVEQHVSTWISAITDHLPMSDKSIAELRAVALRDSRTWRRLQDIKRRGHLADVTLDQVATYADQIGLGASNVVVNGQLVFDPSERFGFLHLLNEDLYEGPLTGTAFESQRKSSMQ